MAVRIGNREVRMAYYGDKALQAIYRGARLVWSSVVQLVSCFGTGKWLGDKPWIGEDKWKGE